MTADRILDADGILGGLDPEQRAAVAAARGPVCILAGAGTGKTRAITHRIAYGVHTGAVRPEHVLAVTFTNRAAGELRGRLRTLGVPAVQAQTFHAAAMRQLRYFWPRVVGGEFPRLISSKLPLVAEAAKRRRRGSSLGSGELRDVAGEIEWMKALQRPPGDYEASAREAGRETPLPAADIDALYAAYEEAKTDHQSIDFEDLLLHMTALLETEPGVAGEVRDRYRSFVVDEYQDVNPLQQRLLDGWLGDRDDLCVVGDPHQTIYSFTGATAEYLRGFKRRYPGATVVKLVRDYRSSAEIVGLANTLVRGGDLVAQGAAGPPPSFTEHPDEVAEAAGVAAAASDLIASGVAAGQIAILYRVNAQSEAYEQALAEVGVAYQVRGGERFFERPEVRQAMVLLRGAAHAGQDGGADADSLGAVVRAVLATAGLTAEPPAGGGAARERWESLSAIAALADDLAPDETRGTLEGFAAELAERASLQHAPSVDGVTLASLHAAKGLEWDAVFLVGLVDGTVPIVHASTPEQVEEERRLLYVGVTRARRHLALSWALARSPGGRASRQPSRFLDDVRPAASLASPSATRGGAREPRSRNRRASVARCRVCGRALAAGAERKLGRCASCPSDMDDALFERLRNWRLERARELSQPAFCVFTDATLVRIAEVRPVSTAELSSISGVGASKLATFGPEVLALCRDS